MPPLTLSSPTKPPVKKPKKLSREAQQLRAALRKFEQVQKNAPRVARKSQGATAAIPGSVLATLTRPKSKTERSYRSLIQETPSLQAAGAKPKQASAAYVAAAQRAEEAERARREALKQAAKEREERIWREAVSQAVPEGLTQVADIATGIPSAIRDPSALNIAMAVTFGLPVGSFFRAGKTLRRGLGGARALTGTRTSAYRGLSAQFPSSPATVTAYGQRALDRSSEALTPAVESLRAPGRSLPARAAGATLTPFSARGRVAKQAGKRAEQEYHRALAAHAPEAKALRKVPKDQGAAFAIDIQLPVALRGGPGVKMVRDKLAGEVKAITSGQTRRVLLARVQKLAGEPKKADELAGLLARIDELPQTARELSDTIRDLDRSLAQGIRYDEEAVSAARTLMEERKAEAIRAGLLEPEEAAAREGLLTRWLGREPTGEEIFFGHRLAERGRTLEQAGSGARLATQPAPAGLGPDDVNELVRFSLGRANLDPKVIVQDWAAMVRYGHMGRARSELAKAGEYVDPTRGIKPGYVEVVAPGELARQVPEDVVNRYLNWASSLSPQAMKTWMRKAGTVASSFNDAVYLGLIYSNPGYIPANALGNLIFASAQQGGFLPVNMFRAAQLVRAPSRLRSQILGEISWGPTVSTAQTRPGHWIAQHVGRIPDDWPRASAFLHEAARAGVISKASPVLTKKDIAALEELFADPGKRALLNEITDRANQAMVDFHRLGATERSLAKGLFVWAWIRGATRYPFRFAADHPLRSAGLAYVAAGGDLPDVDVAGLSPQALEELRDAIAAREMEGMPPWLSGAVRAGTTVIGGEVFPTVLNPRPISPVSTAAETIETVARAVSELAGRPSFHAARPLGAFLNPGITTAISVAQGEDPYGSEVGLREALRAAGERLAPDVGLVRDLISPPASVEEAGLYPGDVSRLGRATRALRILPYAINPEVARQQAARYDNPSPLERLRTAERKNRSAWIEALRKLPDDSDSPKLAQVKALAAKGQLPPDLKQALAMRTQRLTFETRFLEQIDLDALPDKERALKRYEATLRFLLERKLVTPEQVRKEFRYAAELTASQIYGRKGSVVTSFLGGDVLRAYSEGLTAYGIER